jgi:hypothetical protein
LAFIGLLPRSSVRGSFLRYLEPLTLLALPGWAVHWMTWIPFPILKIPNILIFNTCFLAATIFAILEIIHHRRDSKYLRPILGLVSLIILMVFIGVYNLGQRYIIVDRLFVPQYPGWPIYIIGLLTAVSAGIRAPKGWVYLLPYLCAAIPVCAIATGLLRWEMIAAVMEYSLRAPCVLVF